MERVRIVFPFVIAALICGAALAQPHLVFDHKIGTDWKPDSNYWMSFVAISSDGSTVVADGNVPLVESGGTGLWTFPAGDYLRSVPGRTLSISPDFRHLTTEAGVLELETGRAVVRASHQRATYTQAAFDPTEETVALVGNWSVKKGDRQITVLRIADGSVMASFGSRYTTALAFHPDGRVLASGHWNNVTLWDSRGGVKLALLFHDGPHITGAGLSRDGRYVYGIGFSRDGKLLAAGTDDGELQIWDVATRKLLHSLNIGGGDVSNPAFSPDGKLLVAGTYGDGTVSLVDTSSGKILSQIKVSMFGCGSVAFSPDGQYVLTPSNGGQIGPRRFDRGGSVRVFRIEN
jgi:WD40 repeat protein